MKFLLKHWRTSLVGLGTIAKGVFMIVTNPASVGDAVGVIAVGIGLICSADGTNVK